MALDAEPGLVALWVVLVADAVVALVVQHAAPDVEKAVAMLADAVAEQDEPGDVVAQTDVPVTCVTAALRRVAAFGLAGWPFSHRRNGWRVRPGAGWACAVAPWGCHRPR